jgi:hypothetical protein
VRICVYLWRLFCGTHPACGLISDNAQTVAALTAEAMDEPPSFFMRKTAGFAAALADHRPSPHFEFARHKLQRQRTNFSWAFLPAKSRLKSVL